MGRVSGGDGAGGSLTAAEVLDEFGSAIYADFFHYYPTFSWEEFLAGRISPTLFIALLQGLPQESAFRAEWAGGPEHRTWSLDTHLLATVVDLLQGANYQRSGGKGRKPTPINRPRSKDRRSTHDRFQDVLRRARGQNGRSGG